MKKKNLIRIILSAGLCISAVFMNGCSMALESDPGEFQNNSIKEISGLLNRSTVEKMMFMGGSVLYSPKNSVSNQLQKGVKIAYRQGDVYVVDPGDGNLIYMNAREDSVFGYLNVVDISLDSIKLEVFNFSPDGYSNNAEVAGVYTINFGESIDINDDGYADLSYTRPMAGKKGQKTDRWLNFICDANVSKKTMMFSVIPMQYSRSVYPGGIIGINTTGNYVINKYDIGTGNRALVSNISYGDYILDAQSNTVEKYVGEGINGKGARALSDSELKVEEAIDTDSTVEDFYYKSSEFIDEFNITDLLAALPSNLVSTDFKSKTLADNINDLNVLVRQSDFLEKVLQGNTERAPDVVLEINNELANQPLSSELEYFLVARHSLALLYPDLCPDVDLSSRSLCVAFPWLYVDMGTLTSQEEIEEATARAALPVFIGTEKSEKEIEVESAIKARLERYAEEARQAHAGEVGIYTDEFIEYEIKRDVLVKRFDELLSYNCLPFLASLTSIQAFTDIVEQTNGTLAVGIGGYISFANMNPDINLKFGLLARMELEDQVKLSISSTSLFAKKAPDIKELEEGFKEFKEQSEEWTADEEKQLEFFKDFQEDKFKEDMGINNWYFKWTRQNQKVEKLGVIKPSDDALSVHKTISPIPTLPFAIDFDAAFDLLLKSKAIVEFKNCFAGGTYLFTSEVGYKLEWGFRKKFLGIPILHTFYADQTTYNVTGADYAGFAGIKTIDKNQVEIGGGVQVVLVPVINFRAGVGIGKSVALAEASATLGAEVNVYTPIGMYLGFTMNPELKPTFITQFTMDLGVSYGLNFQFYLDPPVLKAKRWKYDVLSVPFIEYNIFDFRFENGKLVKDLSGFDEQKRVLFDRQTELLSNIESLKSTKKTVTLKMSMSKTGPNSLSYKQLKSKLEELNKQLDEAYQQLSDVCEKLNSY